MNAAAPLTEIQRALDLDAVLASARDEAGLREFGDESFFVPLCHLLEDSVRELRFTALGLASTQATIQRYLVNRLRLARDLERHPEILDEEVSDPIIILGMPRTGTTKLQRMMSADPKVQACLTWRVLNPAPFPSARPGMPDPRILPAKAMEASMHANPDFLSSHETLAEDAEEDSFLLLISCDYLMQYIVTPSTSYLSWMRARPRAPAYRFEKTLLQYLQWQDGGRRDRRWVLKNPGHVGGLDALVEAFPKAVLINSHRDMAEVLPSYCRLLYPLLAPLYADFTPEKMARQALDYWGPEMQRQAAVRKQLGKRLNIVDVPYQRVLGQPLSVIEEVYRRAGIELSDQARQYMLAWEGANQQHKHGKSSYSLEQFGLTREEIAKAFPAGS